MKIHLSSYRIPNPSELFALTGKDAEDIRVAIVPNAKDYYSDFVKSIKNREMIQLFDSLGATPEVIDLQNYENDKPEQLLRHLGQFTVLWVSGGNTFCLRHQMVRTGFDKVIGKLLKDGLVYAGESAGAVALGESLKGTELADNPEYAQTVTYDGAKVVPYVIVPHVGNPEFEPANEATRQQFSKDILLELTDNQAAIFNGSLKDYKIIERIQE